MRKGLLTSILALTFSGLQAQMPVAPPRLVVTLTIDQLRTDFLENFSPLYGEKGLKRLMREGAFYRQATYAFEETDRASAIASFYTGSTPNKHGIVGDNWLDVNTLRPINCVDDQAFMGNYTQESSSPSHLLTSTVADELKIATRGKGLVYAIAPFRDAAILAAGHAGNGAFWLNEQTGKWCSSTYYKEFPWWLSSYNERRSPDYRIKGMVWTPLLPVAHYAYLPTNQPTAFKHKPESEQRNKYRRLITSPLINEEINLLVEELLSKGTMGKDNTPDLLALTYYAGTYGLRPIQENALELQDAYARLDKSVEKLLDILEREVGLQNVLFCVASTGYSIPETPDAELFRIPGGEFHLNRCATLLNMYLMATYGEGQYVEAYYNRQIYLNHKLIEKKQLSLTEVQQKAAEFLAQFSGVNEVHAGNDLLLGSWSPEKERIRNGFHRKRSGDLLISILPGWSMVEEDGTISQLSRTANIPTPLILMGKGIGKSVVRTPVSMERIAPTLTSVMRIRAPNGCKELPLDF